MTSDRRTRDGLCCPKRTLHSVLGDTVTRSVHDERTRGVTRWSLGIGPGAMTAGGTDRTRGGPQVYRVVVEPFKTGVTHTPGSPCIQNRKTVTTQGHG